MSEDDFSGFGDPPAFRPCDLCGRATSKSPCWECQLAAEAKREREAVRARALATIPEDFATVRLTAGAELTARVKGLPMPLELAAERVLDARWATLVGASGLGKTTFAAACFAEGVTRVPLPGALFITAEELASASAHHPRGAGEPERIAVALAAPLLVIDDVGGPDVAIDASAVRKVVYRRHGRGQRTWVTTGLTREQLVRGYDDGFARRLLERRSGTVVLRFGDAGASP